jgi:orotate phosphoribosyltransferase
MLRSIETARCAAAQVLFRSGTVRVDCARGFKLKIHEHFPQAPLSPIYVSMRPAGIKDGKLARSDIATIGEAMTVFALLNGLVSNTDYICGIPAAGEPFVENIHTRLSNLALTRIYLEKREKSNKRYISGLREDSLLLLADGRGCLLIDDLVTAADTKLEAIQALRRQKIAVSDLLVFLDRSAGAKDLLHEHGVTLHALWTFDDLINFAFTESILSQDEANKILAYPVALKAYLDMHS